MDKRITISIPLEDAELIERVFLPRNPRKLRHKTPALIAAVDGFKDAISTAQMALRGLAKDR